MAACRSYGVVDPGPFGFQGGCDLVHFRQIGVQGTVIGPGDLSVAHKPDEFVPTEEFVTASLIYRDVAISMLRG
jgi:acetylornithine deacetylase/succinyl-diaminopimelate desuccinylase